MKGLRLICLCLSLVLGACANVNKRAPTANNPTQIPSPVPELIQPTTPATPTAPLAPTTPTSSSLSFELTTQGQITDARLNEVSGLAASNQSTDVLWAVNDSGNASELYRLNTKAHLLDVWDLSIKNRDWEAMASVLIDGRSYLLVAETGDNLQIHAESRLHIFAEPDVNNTNEQPLTPITTLRFRYEGGPRNVEAVGVTNNTIYLLSKERLVNGKSVPSEIFRLPLNLTPSDVTLVADNIGKLALPKRGFNIGILTRLLNIDPIQPTDLVFSADGKHAFVLNYVHILHYVKNDNETWLGAFSRTPNITHHHGLRQAEALTANALGEVWVTSEKKNAPLLAFKAFEPPALFSAWCFDCLSIAEH